ncbi:MAG: response regulator [Elusimicrobia bacterium]|nr:response regulator [Elusimicrobiota bacterium]
MLTILVIDDSFEFKTMVSDYFMELGYKLETAEEGREGILKAKTKKPDIIFLDVMMPGVGGIEVIRELQLDDDTRNIPILVITGTYLNKNLGELFRQEPNCREFMSKTVEMSFLQKKVEAHLPKKT